MKPKVALVHDWLIHMRGGEKVLEAFAEMFPDAPIYTLFYDRDHLSPALKDREIIASWLHYLPGIRRYYRWLLPVLPLAIRSLWIRPDTNLVLSTSHCVAKGIRIPSRAKHVCYCHTPMRYLWGFSQTYFGHYPGWIKPLVNFILNRLRKWDVRSNQGVDVFISNSDNVKERIRTYYNRPATTVHPPLDTGLFSPGGEKQDYYFAVSAFVPYKRVDLIIEAFNGFEDSKRPLLIAGTGPLEEKYRSLNHSPQTRFLGSVSNEELQKLYQEARAVIFPTEEDFGIVPLEAQACGSPVIALGKGGALESVKHGFFFEEQSPDALRKAVQEFEKGPFAAPEIVAGSVNSFDKAAFKAKIFEFLDPFLAKP